MHGDEGGNADAVDEQFSHAVAGGLGGDHHHVHVVRRDDLPVVDAEAVGDHQGVAGLQVGRYLVPVGAALDVVGNHHHDHVGGGGRFGHVGNFQPGFFCRSAAAAAGVQADYYVEAIVLEVQGVGVALAAVPDDGYGLPVQDAHVYVAVVIHIDHKVNAFPR